MGKPRSSARQQSLPSRYAVERWEGDVKRLISATLVALAIGLFVYAANPAGRIKAGLRADAKGLILSLEYSAHLLKV